jgi:general secretion pathway protein I
MNRRHRCAPRGFTLIEVLAALMLIAIVLPASMKGIALSSSAATTARRRTEAAGLAEGKLQEIIAASQWQNTSNLSGDFGTDWPDYTWQATVTPWTQSATYSAASSSTNSTADSTLQQIDLRVIWKARGREDSLTISTLAYERTTTQ